MAQQSSIARLRYTSWTDGMPLPASTGPAGTPGRAKVGSRSRGTNFAGRKFGSWPCPVLWSQ
jgi:hypothetical protein